MSYHALSSGVNIITLSKNNEFKAMTCAWAMMVDYDKLVVLIGSQSETGNALRKGDIIGFSALSSHQKDIAEKIGSVHSTVVDKKSLAQFIKFGNVYVVKEAKTYNECEVIDIYHLPEIEEDHLVYLRIIAHTENEDNGFYRYP